MRSLVQDVRLAVRGFRRTPTFVAAVVAILGVGIGMAVALVTAWQAIFVRRLPVADAERLAVLWPYHDAATELSPPATDLPALRASSRTLRDVAGVAHFGTWTSPFLDGGRTVVLAGTPVTANYFAVLGARPALGRLLHADDETADGVHAMVLSYGAWRRRFGGSPSVVGRRLIDPYTRAALTIVGVAPPGLDYPVGVEAWTPIARGAQVRVRTVARLAPGASLRAARDEFFASIARAEPGMALTGADAHPFTDAVVGDARPMARTLAAAVAVLLGIACVNVGMLSLVRGAARVHELRVRRALGARYRDLVRQLVVEHALLAVASSALGAACASVLLRVLVRVTPMLPRIDDVQSPGGLAVPTAAVTALAVLVFGLVPSLGTARVPTAGVLRDDARAGRGTRRRATARQALVAAQIALAVVLLAGAALLARSLQRLETVDLGYRAERLSIVELAPDWARHDTDAKVAALGDRLEARVRAIPGVAGVTTLLTRPFDGVAINLGVFEAEGQSASEVATSPAIPWEAAGDEYFRTLGIPLVRGRAFSSADRAGAPSVAIVSASAARRLWPGQDPLGRRVRLALARNGAAAGADTGAYVWRTVVGIVPDTRLRALRAPSPMLYVPWRQAGWPGTLLAVRTRRDTPALSAAIRAAARDVDPTLVVWAVRTMDETLAGPLAAPRRGAALVGAFAGVALALTMVGLYGVVATAVRERSREFGIRLAIGATPAAIRRAVLRRALALASIGATAGLLGALAATRVLRALLYEVSPLDPLALLAAIAVLLVVALTAASVPAHAATHIDPAATLRAD